MHPTKLGSPATNKLGQSAKQNLILLQSLITFEPVGYFKISTVPEPPGPLDWKMWFRMTIWALLDIGKHELQPQNCQIKGQNCFKTLIFAPGAGFSFSDSIPSGLVEVSKPYRAREEFQFFQDWKILQSPSIFLFFYLLIQGVL